MLIAHEKTWDKEAFEACVEGMCAQLKAFPYERVAFAAHPSPEIIFLFFAIWKLGKIACPLSTRLPSFEGQLLELGTELFIPKMPEPCRPKPWNLQEDKLATLLFTSGSSGKPKIAALSIGNHLHSAQASLAGLSLGPSDRWQVSLPLFHIAGISILWRCYLSGASMLLSDTFDQATRLSLVPTQLARLLEKNAQLPLLKTVLLGGAPLPHFESPWPVHESYGMTETASLIALDGKVLPGTEVKLQDGEILVRGKTLFQGYFSKDGGLSLPIDEEGWFATKDLGAFDSQGKLQIIGRRDNLFISGGENIQPEEIERLLKTIPGLEEAFVVPVPDAAFGQRPAAFVEPASFTLEEVQSLLKPLLPKFKLPVRLYPLPPKSGLKHSRQELKKLALEFIARQP